MANTQVLTNGYVAHFAGPESAISGLGWGTGPSLTELRSLVNYSAGIRADGTDFNVEASDQVDDRSFADQAGAQSRGFASASGNIEPYTPGADDTTSIHALAYDTFNAPRTRLAYAQRFVTPQANQISAGDEINIFRVITDERAHNRNDASRSLGVGMKLQDDLFINYVVPSSVATKPAITPSSLTLEPGDIAFVDVAYEGVNITVGATYVSSNESVFRVSEGGTIVATGVGTANLIVTYPGSDDPDPVSVTVSTPE